MQHIFRFFLGASGLIALSIIPFLAIDVLAYPIIFLFEGEFISLTQIGLNFFKRVDDTWFSYLVSGSVDINTSLKGFDIIVNGLVNLSMTVSGRWILGLSSMTISICLIFACIFLDVDIFDGDKIPVAIWAGGIFHLPLLPLYFLGFMGILFELFFFF